jgi:hypothetical protein
MNIERKEWAVGRNDGTGWHDIYYRIVTVSRSGEVITRSGIRIVVARAYGDDRAFDIVRGLASQYGELIFPQTWEDVAA